MRWNSSTVWVAVFFVFGSTPFSSYSAPSSPPSLECPKDSDFRFATQKDCNGVCETVFSILRDTSRSAKENWSCKDYAGHISLSDVLTAAKKPKLGYWQCDLQVNACSGKSTRYTPIQLPGGKIISHKNWADLNAVQCPNKIQNQFSSPELCRQTCEGWYRVFRNKNAHNHSGNVGYYSCSDQSPSRSLSQLISGVKQIDYGFWRCHLSTSRCKTIEYPKSDSAATHSNTSAIHQVKPRDHGDPSAHSEAGPSSVGHSQNAD